MTNLNVKKSVYPLLRVRTDKIKENAQTLIAACAKHGIKIWGVSKGISAFPEAARAYIEGGVRVIADSRLDNIRKMKDAGIEAEFALIRIPMRSELEELAELCDYTLISDIGTMRELSAACDRLRRTVKCVVMMDMGDLREGFWFKEAAGAAEALRGVEGDFMRIAGVGANFSCASGVEPELDNLTALAECGKTLEAALGHPLEIYSGGGTCSYLQMERGHMPAKFNNLRIGEAMLLGTDTAFGFTFPELNQDTMQLEAELVEVRVKPTLPVGNIGHDAFGNVPVFEDRGDRRRGILALGKQDVNILGLTPLDRGVSIITASSDHLLVDIEARPDLKVGDVLCFRPDYTAMLTSSTSPYVTKLFE